MTVEYTQADFNDPELTVAQRVNVCLWLIRQWDVDIQAEFSAENLSTAELMIQAHLQEQQGNSFRELYGFSGPLVLVGEYEAFSFVLVGYQSGMCEANYLLSMGSMMVAHARPYYHLIRD